MLLMADFFVGKSCVYVSLKKTILAKRRRKIVSCMHRPVYEIRSYLGSVHTAVFTVVCTEPYARQNFSSVF